jgi:flagellar biosynthesis regulator FlbT
MSNYHRIYIQNEKRDTEIGILIRKLYEKFALKCEKFEKELRKSRDKFFDPMMKDINKTMKSKEHKEFKAKTDAIVAEFNNSEIYKEYLKNINQNSNPQLMDKKFLKKYKALKNKYLKNLARVLRAYHNTPMYRKTIAKDKAMRRITLKSIEAKNMNYCVFKHCREDYAVIIKLLLKYIKNDKRNLKVYNYLKKINTKKITMAEYRRITHIFNRISGRTPNYIG